MASETKEEVDDEDAPYKDTGEEFEGKLVGAFILLVVLATATVVGAFVWTFHDQTISDTTAEWGQFGDYLGGILNPAISGIAFLGFLLTVVMQARQLRHMKVQAIVEELQRLMVSNAADIDRLLEMPLPRFVLPAVKEFAEPTPTVREFLSDLGMDAVLGGDKYKKVLPGAYPPVRFAILEVASSLGTLATLLRQYRFRHGADEVRSYYTVRYGWLATWLERLGYVDGSGKYIAKVFNVELYLRTARENVDRPTSKRTEGSE